MAHYTLGEPILAEYSLPKLDRARPPPFYVREANVRQVHRLPMHVRQSATWHTIEAADPFFSSQQKLLLELAHAFD